MHITHASTAAEYRIDQAAYERDLGAEIQPRHWREAEDRILSDVETFADWLYDKCVHVGAVTSDWEARRADRLAAASAPALLHIALTAARDGSDALAATALRILGADYVSSRSNHHWLLASRFADEDAT